MAHKGAQRIRNIAIVGHRGSGKTSLNEALLFEAGVVNRLGSVADGPGLPGRRPLSGVLAAGRTRPSSLVGAAIG